MKKVYLAILAIFFCQFLLAQSLEPLPKQKGNKKSTQSSIKKRCASAELLQNFINRNPNAENIQQFENWLNQKISERRALGLDRTITPTATLPVVFHIIHDNETVGTGRNVSQSIINHQTVQLNKDFANLSFSPYTVSENTGIQFAMAQTDPNGNTLTEPGIDRINRNSKGWTQPPYTVGAIDEFDDYLTNTIKPNSIWDPTRYVNIWVSEWEAGILGIATFPASSGLNGLDNSETNSTAGVTIGYETLGSVFLPAGTCSDPYNRGRTLTHELGHFFGLRHIWGDGTCATDYCNDTPTHEEDNYGVPFHPKPNGCGTADEMFENYMDYCDDVALNTFTTNQVDRMEAVMLNSPRRASLITSNVPKIAPATTNNIAFLTYDCSTVITVNERSSMTTCPKYSEIILPLIVDNMATATTNVTINTSGTALDGAQYQVMTPTITFNANDITKDVVIRIFDDGVASGNSTIIVSYTIGAGAGVSAGTSNQTYTINLIDNDGVSTINNSVAGVILYSENFGTTTGSNQLPTGWIVGNAASTTNKWVVNNAGAATYGFTGNTLHISNGNTNAVNNGTAAINYGAAVAGSDTRAFTPAIPAVNGYSNLNVTFQMVCNGELDAGTYYDFGLVYYTVDGTNYSIISDINDNVIIQGVSTRITKSLNLPASVTGTPNFGLLFRWISDGSIQNQPPFAIDDIVISSVYSGVETVVNQTVTKSQANGQSAQYISNSNRIIAQIANPNANIGCVTATVTGAGNGQASLLTNSGSYLRSEKVIRLAPVVANTTATYQATFYFTTDELAIWGANVPNLKIMKVADGTNLASVLNNSNSAIFTPVVNDLRSTAGYASFSINATGGFSQFVLVSQNVTLPVSLLNFEARPNGKNILLNWSTSTEINNRGFVVERSSDGTNFERIGWVDGAINSNRETSYSFTDNFVQPDKLYYYRLRQTDMDTRETLSEIRSAKIKGSASIQITLSPNPAKDQIRIFTSGSNALSDINLYDTKGKLVKTWRKVNCSLAPYQLNIGSIAAGVYLVQVVSGNDISTKKLIIQQ